MTKLGRSGDAMQVIMEDIFPRISQNNALPDTNTIQKEEEPIDQDSRKKVTLFTPDQTLYPIFRLT